MSETRPNSFLAFGEARDVRADYREFVRFAGVAADVGQAEYKNIRRSWRRNQARGAERIYQAIAVSQDIEGQCASLMLGRFRQAIADVTEGNPKIETGPYCSLIYPSVEYAIAIAQQKKEEPFVFAPELIIGNIREKLEMLIDMLTKDGRPFESEVSKRILTGDDEKLKQAELQRIAKGRSVMEGEIHDGDAKNGMILLGNRPLRSAKEDSAEHYRLLRKLVDLLPGQEVASATSAL